MAKPVQAWRPDWREVGDAELDLLFAEAKEALQGTVDLGVSSDQRSATLAGVFGAGAFALFTISATIFADQDKPVIFLVGALLVGSLLLVASGFCTLAAWPGDFFVSGYEPKRLFPSATSKPWMQRYTIEDIQFRIETNRREIEREARLTGWAIRFALAAMIVSFLVVCAGVLQMQRDSAVSRPSSAAGSGQAWEARMPPMAFSSATDQSLSNLRINPIFSTPPPGKQP